MRKMKVFERIKEDFTIMKKTLEGQHPNPHCEWCSRWERLLLYTQITFMLMIGVGGILLIQLTEGDLETQCCKEVKAMRKFFGDQHSLYIFSEEVNYEWDDTMFDNNLSTVWMPEPEG